MCTDSKRSCMTVGTEKELHEWCRDKEDAFLCASVGEGALGDTVCLCPCTRGRNAFPVFAFLCVRGIHVA